MDLKYEYEKGKRTEGACQPDYESEYHRQLEVIQQLTKENEQLKKALVRIALKL